MSEALKRRQRCAVYTRKSSEEGLDQEYNSIDAQRDAGHAYVASQRAEGWIPVADDYDDGGFSGGSMDRPALKRLMQDIEAGLIDIVVVYKIDRLTRSLADFSKMVEVFERHGVSFVSVTQQFNTTTSMGRLMLNVLLSFAQFEREVTGERIRDKIAASKRKGMWMGGIPFEKLKIEPTCLVETSPGNFQAWYFLAEPERDRGRAERLIKGMIASGLTADGSDPGMNGVTRYGRLPEGVNDKTKYADESGNPFVQRVAHWSPLTRYSLDEIAAAYAIDLDVVAAPTRRRGKRARIAASLPALVGGFIAVIEAADLYLEPLASIPGAHHIICPWVHEHTDEDSTGTVYFEPSDENAWAGGFKCHHGHCQHRTIADLTHFITRLLKITKEQ